MKSEKGTYTYEYPRPAVTTDCIIFGYDMSDGLSILLVRRGIEPFKGQWAFPGGFLQMDENTEACAIRELQEETGLLVGTPETELSEEDYEDEEILDSEDLTDAPLVSFAQAGFIEQLGCFSDVDRDPRGRVITIAYYAVINKSRVKAGDDANYAAWFPINDVPSLAFDHDHILRIALKRLKERIHFKPIGFELLPEVFSMSQLQAIYEAILDVQFDKRNFSSKMLKLGIMDPIENNEPVRKGNPQLYRFNKDRYKAIKSAGFKLEF